MKFTNYDQNDLKNIPTTEIKKNILHDGASDEIKWMKTRADTAIESKYSFTPLNLSTVDVWQSGKSIPFISTETLFSDYIEWMKENCTFKKRIMSSAALRKAIQIWFPFKLDGTRQGGRCGISNFPSPEDMLEKLDNYLINKLAI